MCTPPRRPVLDCTPNHPQSTRCRAHTVVHVWLTSKLCPIVALVLRPSESLAVRLQTYVEVHAGATPDIGWGSRLHHVSWLSAQNQKLE
eukprot:2826150-Prymnesium_polylepis.1